MKVEEEEEKTGSSIIFACPVRVRVRAKISDGLSSHPRRLLYRKTDSILFSVLNSEFLLLLLLLLESRRSLFRKTKMDDFFEGKIFWGTFLL